MYRKQWKKFIMDQRVSEEQQLNTLNDYDDFEE